MKNVKLRYCGYHTVCSLKDNAYKIRRNLEVNGSIILERILNGSVMAWTEFSWLRTGFGNVVL